MKKVILLLVEGPSDEDALVGPTASAITNAIVRSDCFHTDVTTVCLFPRNAIFEVVADVGKTVRKFVESHLEKNQGYTWSDLAAVFHVVDLDGALVRPDAVVEDRDARKTLYGADSIRAARKDFILERNRVKKASIQKLRSMESVGKGRRRVPYRVFFMSRNLEHALYGISDNLSDDAKERLSSAFAKECKLKPSFFLDTLRDEAVAVPGNYDESWGYAFKGNNSLKRGSNYHLLFDMVSGLFCGE